MTGPHYIRRPSSKLLAAFRDWLARNWQSGARLFVLEGLTGTGKTTLTGRTFSMGIHVQVEDWKRLAHSHDGALHIPHDRHSRVMRDRSGQFVDFCVRRVDPGHLVGIPSGYRELAVLFVKEILDAFPATAPPILPPSNYPMRGHRVSRFALAR
jgi:hypothetical protein